MIGPDQDPVRREITEEFFRIVAERSDEYELFISPMTIQELENAKSEEKREAGRRLLETFEHVELPQNDEAENLAWFYVADGVLSYNHIEDLTHVAYATFFRCDYVITWNMRHLANPRTVSRVNATNTVERYGKIFIATPEFFTGGQIYGK